MCSSPGSAAGPDRTPRECPPAAKRSQHDTILACAPGGLQVEPPLLLARQDLARELRCSVRELDRLRARGLLPAPIRLGGSTSPRWRREDVVAWVREVRP